MSRPLVSPVLVHRMSTRIHHCTDVIFKEPFDNDFSWPAIGGIHGMPYVRWGDSGPADAPGGDTFGGYCTHGSVLFPTWHRPYVALFEVNLLDNPTRMPRVAHQCYYPAIVARCGVEDRGAIYYRQG